MNHTTLNPIFLLLLIHSISFVRYVGEKCETDPTGEVCLFSSSFRKKKMIDFVQIDDNPISEKRETSILSKNMIIRYRVPAEDCGLVWSVGLLGLALSKR